MYLIEKVSLSLASKIASSLQLGEEQKSIIAYGAISFLLLVYSFTLVVIFGLVFGVLSEALIVLLVESILRKYSGGVHSHSPNRCAVIGTIFSVGLGLLSVHQNWHINFTIIIGLVIFIWAFIVIYELAPVDSPSKPIKREKKRLHLKKCSILSLCCLLVISAILVAIFKYTGALGLQKYILCMYFGVTWQVFSLTKLGHAVLGKLDTFLDIKSYKRR